MRSQEMASENLTQQRVDRTKVLGKDYELRDHVVTQLYYRVKASGHKSWIVKYTDPETGDKRRKYTLNVPSNNLEDARTAARQFFADIILTKKNPKTLEKEKKQKQLKLEDALKLYEPFAKKLKSGDGVILDLKQICRSPLGEKPINQITRQDINNYIDEQGKVLTKRTVNKKITLLYGMLNKLYKEEIISPNDIALPLKPSKIKEIDSDKSRRYLQVDERKKLLSTAKKMKESPWLYPAVVLSLNTGIRPNSLFSLVWDDIDWKSHSLHLRAAHMKTSDDWIIPLNKNAIQVLQDWRNTHSQTNKTERILTKENNERITKKDWTNTFIKLVKTSGIEGNITWYNMRHDFASQLVMAGASLYTVKELMCHKNITTTQVYAHLAPDLKSAAVKLLENI